MLRWFSKGLGEDYLGKLGEFSSQKGAERFASADDALDEVHPLTLFGAGGPDDLTGWKALRLVRKS